MLTLLVPNRRWRSHHRAHDTNSTRKHNYAHKTLQKVIQIDKSNNKAHTLTIKIANNIDISLAFCLSCGSVVLALMASSLNLHKRL